jgi:brefeldin A-resistance guanine nucleotide exchange factor 1
LWRGAETQLNLGAWADHLRTHPPPSMEEAAAHAETLASLWATLLEALTKLAVEARADVRDHALLALQRVLLAAEGMTLDAATLVAAFDARVLPVVAELSQAVSDRAADVPHAERSLRLAVTLLTKGFLQHLPRLHHVPAFLPLWQAILAALERAIKVSSRSPAVRDPQLPRQAARASSTSCPARAE